jgi:hypothetical protein
MRDSPAMRWISQICDRLVWPGRMTNSPMSSPYSSSGQGPGRPNPHPLSRNRRCQRFASLGAASRAHWGEENTNPCDHQLLPSTAGFATMRGQAAKCLSRAHGCSLQVSFVELTSLYRLASPSGDPGLGDGFSHSRRAWPSLIFCGPEHRPTLAM